MWNWIACYLHGHEYTICGESGAMFLRCVNCGRRSTGWTLANAGNPGSTRERK